MERRVEPELLLGQRQRPLRVRAGELELTAMDGDPGDREQALRRLDPVLDETSCERRRIPLRAASGHGPDSTHESDQSIEALWGSSRSRQSRYSRSSSRRACSKSPHALNAATIASVARLRSSGLRGRSRARAPAPRVPRASASPDHAAELGEHDERTDPHGVVVELVGNLECCTRVLQGGDEPLAEAGRPREPGVNERLKSRA